MVIGYKIIDQGNCYCQNDPKDNGLSVEMKHRLNEYTGCRLNDFDKKGEQRSDKFRFQTLFQCKNKGIFQKCEVSEGTYSANQGLHQLGS